MEQPEPSLVGDPDERQYRLDIPLGLGQPQDLAGQQGSGVGGRRPVQFEVILGGSHVSRTSSVACGINDTTQ